jgi:hypothetical protein
MMGTVVIFSLFIDYIVYRYSSPTISRYRQKESL